jgi:TRAP-type C4-dicarboxylate transport system substrate-binding protein
MARKLLSVLIFSVAVAAPALAEPIKLRFGHPAPPNSHVVANFAVPWAAKVTKESEGTLELSVFAGGQLGGNETLLDAVKSGVADIAWVNTAYYAGKFNRTNVGTLPFEVASSIPASAAMWELYQKGIIAQEVDDVRPLALFALPQSGIHSSIPIRRLEDLRGKRIASAGGAAINVIQRLGGIPVPVEFTEIYEAFNRGTIQGAVLQYTAMEPLRLWEVAKFHTETRLNGAVYVIAMNKAKYASLPQKAKDAIDRNSGLQWSREWGTFWDLVEISGKKRVEAAPGNQVITLEPAEQQRWKDAIASVTDAWANSTPDGAKILAIYRAERDSAAK